jgi:hypothetical protein
MSIVDQVLSIRGKPEYVIEVKLDGVLNVTESDKYGKKYVVDQLDINIGDVSKIPPGFFTPFSHCDKLEDGTSVLYAIEVKTAKYKRKGEAELVSGPFSKICKFKYWKLSTGDGVSLYM